MSPPPDQLPDEQPPPGGETRFTVVLALAANIAVALAKLLGGAVTGSAALLSEAAHSVADTLNEVFLLFSLGRSERPADRDHPFGYGKERFFWSLLAAVGIFVSGAGFSFYQGVSALTGHEKNPSTVEFLVVYVVLALSLVFEGTSLVRAYRQVRGEAADAGRSLLNFVRRSPDPTVKTVASEDSVAVLGIVVAAAGTAAHQVSGYDGYEGIASLVIALLLAYVAYALGRDNMEALIGEAADPTVRLTAFNVISGYDEVIAVKQILTMQLGPNAVLLACRVQFADDILASRVEEVSTDIERVLQQRVPTIQQVFVDPSRVDADDLLRTSERLAESLDEVRELDGEDAAQRLRAGRA